MPASQLKRVKNPFLSIVTVHYQDFDRLKVTCSSIESMQGHEITQWIVIDGGAVPANEEHRLIMSRVGQLADRLVSEPDSGIYDAMNKGFSEAIGEYVLYVNAGDKIFGSFSPFSIMEAIGKSRPDMIWGRTKFEYLDGTFGLKKLRGPKWMVYGMPVCHQAVFFLRSEFEKLKFDTRFKIAADYELMARALQSGARVQLVQDTICEYEAGGVSQQDRRSSLSEESLVRVQHYGIPVFLSEIISFMKILLWKIHDLSPGLNRAWRKRI